jgi:GTPase SAR1 family protein
MFGNEKANRLLDQTTCLQRDPSSSDEYEYLLKIAIIGDCGCGRNQFFLSWLDDHFKTEETVNTIGMDMSTSSLSYDLPNAAKHRKVKVNAYNLSDNSRFNTITSSFLQSSPSIILIYSVEDIDSYNNLKNWMATIRRENPKATITIVGIYTHISSSGEAMSIPNSKDSSYRAVSYMDVSVYLDSYGIAYVEVDFLKKEEVINAVKIAILQELENQGANKSKKCIIM